MAAVRTHTHMHAHPQVVLEHNIAPSRPRGFEGDAPVMRHMHLQVVPVPPATAKTLPDSFKAEGDKFGMK